MYNILFFNIFIREIIQSSSKEMLEFTKRTRHNSCNDHSKEIYDASVLHCIKQINNKFFNENERKSIFYIF